MGYDVFIRNLLIACVFPFVMNIVIGETHHGSIKTARIMPKAF